MKFFVRAVLLLALGAVLLTLALVWVGLEILISAGPDISVHWDDEVFRWTLSETESLGGWWVGLLLGAVALVLLVPLILLLGVAVPLLVVVLMMGLAVAAAVLAVALVLSPLWLVLWGLWRALRPAAPHVLAARA